MITQISLQLARQSAAEKSQQQQNLKKTLKKQNKTSKGIDIYDKNSFKPKKLITLDD